MTIREKLSAGLRRAGIVAVVGLFIWVVTVLLTAGEGWFGLFIIPATVVLLWGLPMRFGLRCPRCRNYLGYALTVAGATFRVSDKIHLCPFCGVDLDTEIENEQSGTKPAGP